MDDQGELPPGRNKDNSLRQIATADIPENDPFILKLRVLDAKMDQAYERQLKQETRPEATVIGLDDIKDGDGSADHRIRRTLEVITKYGEYTKRLKDDKRDLITSPYARRSDYYKREAARLVITRGKVNTWALGKAVEQVHGLFDGQRFTNGCGVVQNYVEDGGGDVVGGTGLPNFTGRPAVVGGAPNFTGRPK